MAEAGTPRDHAPPLLGEPADVERALKRFHDVFDPRTGSILFLGGTKRFRSDPFHPGFLAGVEERAELVRGLRRITPRERLLLFLWYVEGWSASDIAERLGISRVHCYRLRSRALSALASTDPPRAGDGVVGATELERSGR